MSNQKRVTWGQVLLWATALIVAGSAIAATAHGLYEVALSAGVPSELAWSYPVITDGLALVAYVSTTQLTHRPDRAYAWSVVVLAAGLSGLAQAVYLAGGVADVNPVVKLWVGAWPAIAAAIVAHLLFMLGHNRSRQQAQPDSGTDANEHSHAADTAPESKLPDAETGVHERERESDGQPSEPVTVHASVERPIQPSVQPGVQPKAVQVYKPAPVERSASGGSVRSVGARDRARSAAQRFAHEHRRLPTVTELQELADTSRGTAANALKDLREQRAALHVVNADAQEATQP